MTRGPGATRRDVLGLAGVALATAASGGRLLAGALESPGDPAATVPPETIRIGRRGRGTPGTLRVDPTKLGTGDLGVPGTDDPWWVQTNLRPEGSTGTPKSVWFRRGTCVEVEDVSGPYAEVEGVLSEFDELLLSGQKRVRVQVPTGGVAPPVHEGGYGPSSAREVGWFLDDSSGESGQFSVLHRGDAVERLHFGRILTGLARRFEGTAPVLAGEGVFEADMSDPNYRDRRFPADEDTACTDA